MRAGALVVANDGVHQPWVAFGVSPECGQALIFITSRKASKADAKRAAAARLFREALKLEDHRVRH